MKEALFTTHSDLEDRHWWFRGRRRAIRELGMLLLPARGSVVDVGCGTGADLAAFPGAFRRHGIDISPAAVAFAREHHPEVHFEVGAVPDAGADVIGSADLVLLCDVLEHIEQDSSFIESLIGMMKPGANLLLTVPADPRLWSPHDEVYGHFRRYTRETLIQTWRDAPVNARLVAAFNRRLYPLARVARLASAIRGRGWGSEASDLTLPWRPVNAVLERLFASEIPALVAALEAGPNQMRGRGVSLLAVLERADAPVRPGTSGEPGSESANA